MAANIEIKARLRDVDATRARAGALSDVPVTVLIQKDTFYHSPQARLKLREQEGAEAELIYYERADAPGPKKSEYELSPVLHPHKLHRALSAAFGIRGVVHKRRELYWVGRTRIHIDDVEGLGTFLELEVPTGGDRTAAEGHEIARQLMSELGVTGEDLVSGAYIDLLAKD